MDEIRIKTRVDARGQVCPVMVIRAKKALYALEPGEALEVVATDPASEAWMSKFADRMGHELLECRTEAGAVHLVIRKAKQGPFAVY